MSIKSEIARISGAKDAISAAITEKGVEVPEDTKIDGLAPLVQQIQGGGGGDFEITDASYLFYHGARIEQRNEIIKCLKDVTDVTNMFYECTSVENVDLSNTSFKLSGSSGYVFYGCTNLQSVKFDSDARLGFGSPVSIFQNCGKLKTLVLPYIYIDGSVSSSSLGPGSMFSGCSLLSEIDTSKIDISGAKSLSYMFNNCSSLTSVDISHFDVSEVSRVEYMFRGCSSLQKLDVSVFAKSAVQFGYLGHFTDGCSALAEITGVAFPSTYSTSTSHNNVFPSGTSSSRMALRRLVFKTDLPDGQFAFRAPIYVPYCSFERDGVLEMFNTLSDLSGTSYAGRPITLTGNPCVTDGSLTDEDIAIATEKGWTVVTA